MSDLDPKVYPLASTPTPASIKKMFFRFGENQAFFQEADDSAKALDEVSSSNLSEWPVPVAFTNQES
jgi:F-box and WD-40 domain protein CDC4